MSACLLLWYRLLLQVLSSRLSFRSCCCFKCFSPVLPDPVAGCKSFSRFFQILLLLGRSYFQFFQIPLMVAKLSSGSFRCCVFPGILEYGDAGGDWLSKAFIDSFLSVGKMLFLNTWWFLLCGLWWVSKCCSSSHMQQVPGVLPSSSKLIPVKVGKGAVLETC